MIKAKVRFSVEYETTIEVESVEDLPDAVCDCDIPETPATRYVANSYSIVSVVANDETGVLIPVPGFTDDFEDDEE